MKTTTICRARRATGRVRKCRILSGLRVRATGRVGLSEPRTTKGTEDSGHLDGPLEGPPSFSLHPSDLTLKKTSMSAATTICTVRELDIANAFPLWSSDKKTNTAIWFTTWLDLPLV